MFKIDSYKQMDSNSLQLRLLTTADEKAFSNAIAEFQNTDKDFEFAFNYNPLIPFSDYVDLLSRWSFGIDLPDNFVPNTYLVGVIGEKIVGRISIRHILNDYLASAGGHIGYGVVPSERKKGYGTSLLKLALPFAQALGILHALVTCDENNIGSKKIIERNGGVFENLVQDKNTGKTKRRYWIDTAEK